MWHEARRQERKIRGMLVDYRRRAERRRDFYEKIKADPTQFLQIHGRQCKIHLDPAVAAAADSAVMMPWQGQSDNLIDRFDVRAHLDYIPVVKKEEEQEVSQEERHLNYERYRIIAQNSFLGISEEKFLKQLHLEEQFGYTESKTKKEPKATGAAIGFDYEEGTAITQPVTNSVEENDSDDNSCDSDLDVDLAINVSKIDSLQAHEMNKHGRNFGMAGNDFYSFLTDDMEEAESYRLAREEEHEKALFSGRKSRRERRAHREKRLANRVLSPPSYAARESPTYPQLREESKSPSRTPSPENSGKITYITSFGDDEEPSGSKPTYADKVKYGRPKKKMPSSERIVFYDNERTGCFSRDATFDRKRKFNSRSRSRSTSKCRSRRRRSRSRSRRRSMSHCSRSRSRSRGSRNRNRSKRSRSNSRERHSYTRSVKSYRRRSPSSSSCSSAASKSSKHQSVSPPKQSILAPKLESPPKVVTRYYGRRKSDMSSSESSDSDEENNKDVEMKATYNAFSSETSKSGSNNTGTLFKKSTASLTVQEKLKRKRQALLNKQFKKDKIAEELKAEREKQEQQMREDELREIAIKLRRKQREKRHAYESSHSSSGSSSCSESSTQEDAKPESEPESPRSKSKERESRRRDRKERRGSRDRDDRGRSNHRDRSGTRRDRERKRERSYSPRRNRDREMGKEREKRDNSGNSREKKLVDY